MLKEVTHLSALGFALHWLHPKSKRPIGEDWSEKPVATAAALRATYREGNNLGVRLGQWSKVGGGYLHIIDMDIRKPELVDVAKAKLAEVFPEFDFENAVTVISGSGGESRHFYLLSERPFPPRKFAHSVGFEMVPEKRLNKKTGELEDRPVKKWDWELHLLGTGAQAAIPPSIHDKTGRPYRWDRRFDPTDVDLGLCDIISAEAVARLVGYDDDPDGEPDPERMQRLGLSLDEIRANLEYLPFEDHFDDRDGWFRTGMAIHHETEGSKEGFKLWCEFSRRSEKFDLDDSKRVWRSFKNRTGKPYRMASVVAIAREERASTQMDDIEDDFENQETPEVGMFDDLLGDTPAEAPKKLSKSQQRLAKAEVEQALGKDAPRWVQRINTKHAVARVSGKTVVMDFHPDGRVSYGTVGDLHNLYENDRRAKDDTTEAITKAWMREKGRRTYLEGIIFAPNRVVEGAYNHWQGFSVEPYEGSEASRGCKLFLKHLRDVICSGNEDRYRYALQYWAHMIQKPEDKPGVAFVVKGKKGTGKDTIAEYLGRIVKHHYITIANKDQLTGKFNQHQEKCLLLHVQEGFWAGDKRDEGPLKYLITSRDVMIEPKGLNAFTVESVLRVFISSNERWVVPASDDERRFFVLNVSDKHRRDHTYFKALRAEMHGDGPSALLTYLSEMDLSDFEVRDVPDTEALAEQKVQGLKNVERWWISVLEHGSLMTAGSGHGITDSAWAGGVVRIEKDEFRDNYVRWMRTRRYDGEEVNEREFGRRMMEMLPEIKQIRPSSKGSVRPRFYVLPDLDAARRSFERYLGSELMWPEEDIRVIEAPDDEEDDL